MSLWQITNKGDKFCRMLADRHYSRQTIGAPSFTRPGYNLVLKTSDNKAVFVWFRPKWESGIKGTLRKDGLFAIECTLFHNAGPHLSSNLIKDACALAVTWEHALDTQWPDGLITGVNSILTSKQRSRNSPPGKCFIAAGWKPFPHNKGKADVWLQYFPVDTRAA